MMNIKRYGTEWADRVFIRPVDEHEMEMMDSEARMVESLCGHRNWCIAAVPVRSWNDDLTPWKAEPVFGKRGFGGGAEATLNAILGRVIPALEIGESERRYYLCGYSLAGLFSLWAAYRTDLFAGVAAASPSLWYRDWIAYARENAIKTQNVYLSLGDQEERTKNLLMATVGTCVREQYRLLAEAGVNCRLEWNPGNHFADSDLRMAKGIAWLLSV